MKVALYARVSTDEQTVSQQLDALRGDCQRHGWTIIEEIEDTISGMTFTRKGLDRMMELVRRKKIDLVVCHKLDRLGRCYRPVCGGCHGTREAGLPVADAGVYASR